MDSNLLVHEYIMNKFKNKFQDYVVHFEFITVIICQKIGANP